MKKIFIYLAIITFFTLTLFFKNRGIKDYIFMHKKLDELIEKNRNLANENKNLKLTIEKLKKDYKFIEKIAREKYNMIKKDEIMIRIIKLKGGKK